MKKTFVRLLVIIPVIAIQTLWLLLLIRWLSPYSAVISFIMSIFAVFFVLYIITKRDESTYKILWLLIILTMPLAGASLYLLFGNKRSARILQGLLKRAELPPAAGTPEVLKGLEETDQRMSQTMGWLQKKTGCPLLKNESVKYYRLGDELFPDMLNDLRSAEEYIFVEYFIIANGVMWNAMVDIMSEKARQGVDVRVMYDDLGSISTFSANDVRQLTERGIKCVTFNPFVVLSGNLNYRDHRKMLIVDGRVAYSGGINIADEYINQKERFGHWKDTGVRLEGEGAWGLTAQFIQMCVNLGGTMHNERDYYRPHSPVRSEGFCQPFVDGPQNNPDDPAEDVFLQLISGARRFLYITTPYFVPDNSIMRALCIAGDGGVDVRLMLPGTPDHWYADFVAESHFGELLSHGVKIYRYTPGFLHAKSVMADREAAFIGSVNMDYRSFELHYECGVMLYGAPMIESLLEDMDHIVEQSHRVTLEEWKHRSWTRRVFEPLLRLFAIWM